MASKSARHGQNFLTDHRYADRILDAVPLDRASILEIGPGPGILTSGLIARGFPSQRIWAVELDLRLARELAEKWPKLNLLTGDILQKNLDEINLPRPCHLLSNLPYDISHPFFDRLILWSQRFTGATIMVQKEFADKILREQKRSAQGHMISAMYRVESLFDVPPGAFRPSPRVQSCVLQLTPLAGEIPERERDSCYFFLKECFASPRKTLYNNLRKHHPDISLEALESCGIGGKIRAESVGTARLLDLWRRIQGKRDQRVPPITKAR